MAADGNLLRPAIGRAAHAAMGKLQVPVSELPPALSLLCPRMQPAGNEGRIRQLLELTNMAKTLEDVTPREDLYELQLPHLKPLECVLGLTYSGPEYDSCEAAIRAIAGTCEVATSFAEILQMMREEKGRTLTAQEEARKVQYVFWLLWREPSLPQRKEKADKQSGGSGPSGAGSSSKSGGSSKDGKGSGGKGAGSSTWIAGSNTKGGGSAKGSGSHKDGSGSRGGSSAKCGGSSSGGGGSADADVGGSSSDKKTSQPATGTPPAIAACKATIKAVLREGGTKSGDGFFGLLMVIRYLTLSGVSQGDAAAALAKQLQEDCQSDGLFASLASGCIFEFLITLTMVCCCWMEADKTFTDPGAALKPLIMCTNGDFTVSHLLETNPAVLNDQAALLDAAKVLVGSESESDCSPSCCPTSPGHLSFSCSMRSVWTTGATTAACG